MTIPLSHNPRRSRAVYDDPNRKKLREKVQTHSDGSKERWRDIPDYEGWYRISDRGRLKSVAKVIMRKDGKPYTAKEQIHKPPTYTTGYLMATLYKQGIIERMMIHQLVLLAFIGPCPKGQQCRHLDGDSKNNRIENLCWGTASQDREDQARHGTMYRGEKQHLAKVTES